MRDSSCHGKPPRASRYVDSTRQSAANSPWRSSARISPSWPHASATPAPYRISTDGSFTRHSSGWHVEQADEDAPHRVHREVRRGEGIAPTLETQESLPGQRCDQRARQNQCERFAPEETLEPPRPVEVRFDETRPRQHQQEAVG